MTTLRKAFQAVSSKSSDDDDTYESGTEEASDFGLVFASDISSGSDEEANAEGEAERIERISKGTTENRDDDNDTTEGCCDNKTALLSESSSEETDEETAKRCSQGYHSFLASCLERKLKIKEMFLDKSAKNLRSNALLPLLGPENRIAAVCNFRARKVDTKKRVIHITFLSVRKHLRRLGIGTRIIDIIKTPQMSGLYDAMVVHADLNATEFFARNGFSGDPLLNKQWASFAGEYVNCLLMTYFPPLSFSSPTTSSSKLLQSIDKSIDNWLVATGNVHQMQYTLCKRLRAEVVRLQNQLLSQDSLVRVLKREVVKQAHIIEGLRGRLQKCGGDVDTGTSDPDTVTFTMLPPPLDPESQLSMSYNGTTEVKAEPLLAVRQSFQP
ncbi:Acyl coenzyme A N acyltransferase [Echinococcus multilocularis]|uniref:Acyl coenzyme A N acyltransferase n=1 Tax=Echinococcus multilocularis TaxID=6211 RepID=A0A068YMQ1_ECHMU|nr:Acyl coenzyme A N acyltransferase [Echinococcus multilocularis]